MALTAQAPPPASWSRWPQHHPNGDYVMMDPGVLPYDSRPGTSTPLQRPMMAQNFFPGHAYTAAPTPSMTVPHSQYLPGLSGLPPVTYDGYAPFAPSPVLGSPFKQERYLERPQLRVVSYGAASDYNRGGATRDATESRSPSIKSEPRTMSVASKQSTSPTSVYSTQSLSAYEAPEVRFNTHVDALMKAIQSKGEEEVVPAAESLATEPEHVAQHWDIKAEMLSYPQPPLRPETPRAARIPARTQRRNANKSARRFRCDFAGCHKLFTQKTHLDTHIRSHTGEQPYVCTLGCGKRFSQHGNQKIHERRHTGERPYVCTTCGKKFPQHGTLMAHAISHSKAKPYSCKLDNCNKQFTQRGNLKSHQNKFHGDTLEALIKKFATVTPSQVSDQDRELWEYFANLYKNSNKGIKGRGKHHRVKRLTPTSSTPASPSAAPFYSSQPQGNLSQILHHAPSQATFPHPPHLHQYHGTTHLASFSLSRPHLMGTHTHPRDVGGHGGYDMFEGGEDESVIGSGSSTTAYEEDHGRELAFGDRMY